MTTGGSPPEIPVGEPSRRSLMHRLRTYFLTGLLIAGPLFLTIYFAWTFIEWADSWVTPFIPKVPWLEMYLPYSVPGFGLVVALIFITILGFLTANLVGRTLIVWGESMLGRMPLIRNLYRALKQLFETAFAANSKPFKTVILVEYPRKGIWAIAFLIGEIKGEIREKIRDGSDDEFVAIFIPTAHITGYTAYVRRKDVIVLDMSAEDAAKVVISAGLVGSEPGPDIASGKPISLAEAARRVRADSSRRG